MDVNSRGAVRAEPGRKRVRAYLAGRLVADTRHPVLVWEIPYYPAYYLPAGDVTAELAATGKSEHSPSRGDAVLYDVRVDGAVAAGAAKQYPDSPLAAIRGLVRFDWDAMDGGWRKTNLSTPTRATPTTGSTSSRAHAMSGWQSTE